jgi:hypothetical protein
MYDHQERLEREFAPTLTHLREVETQIEFHKAEIAKLTDIHRRLQGIERLVHPPEPKPKAPKPKPSNGVVKETTLQDAIVYLRDNYEADEDIYASLLNAEESWQPSSSHTSKILAVLHERGQIRLSSTGQGGRKNFRVVS